MKKFVFISGLHRSGTSILHRTLRAAPSISGFENTGEREDEGQLIQTVYNRANVYGGPGHFAFDERARLDENSPLITSENKEKLLREWGKYWDNEKPIWVEKSPPNLIRTRFLQELFPDAYFVTITRHPLAVSMATQKWKEESLEYLISHWLTAHRIYREDKLKLKNEISFSYEYMVQHPTELFEQLGTFLDTEIPITEPLKDGNAKYFKMWSKLKIWHWTRWNTKRKCAGLHEKAVNEFGYSLLDLERHPTVNQGF